MAAEIASSTPVKTSWLIGTLVAFLVFVFIAGYSSRMANDYTGYDQNRAKARHETLAKVQHDENALLETVDDQGNPTAAWVDQDKGFIKIPIEQAMTHEVDDMKNQPAATGCEIPGAAPAPAPAGSSAGASTSAPAPASGSAAMPAPAPAATTEVSASKPQVKVKTNVKK